MASARPGSAVSVWPLWIAAAGLSLLPVSLFFDWYEYEILGGRRQHEGYVRLTGWQAFEMVDAVLVVLAVAGVILVVRELRGAPTGGDWMLWALGAVASLVVVLQLVDSPLDIRGYDVSHMVGAGLVWPEGCWSFWAESATSLPRRGEQRRVARRPPQAEPDCRYSS